MPTDSSKASLPVVVLPSCQRTYDGHPVHQAGRKYVDAVRLAGALPLVAPPCNEAELQALLAVADGVLLTGSPSNVHPSHFDETVLDPSLPLDEARDALTLPLIREVLARGLPLLAICRGTQEVNVALGGSLHQAVHTLPGRMDHRGPEGRDQGVSNEVAYGPCHPVQVQAGGALAAVTGRSHFMVNSLHGQAVNRLAPGLRVEALADDGTIEAFSVQDTPGFNLCLQWHPEWQAASNPVSMALLQAFGRAVLAYQQQRRASPQRTPAAGPPNFPMITP